MPDITQLERKRKYEEEDWDDDNFKRIKAWRFALGANGKINSDQGSHKKEQKDASTTSAAPQFQPLKAPRLPVSATPHAQKFSIIGPEPGQERRSTDRSSGSGGIPPMAKPDPNKPAKPSSIFRQVASDVTQAAPPPVSIPTARLPGAFGSHARLTPHRDHVRPGKRHAMIVVEDSPSPPHHTDFSRSSIGLFDPTADQAPKSIPPDVATGGTHTSLEPHPDEPLEVHDKFSEIVRLLWHDINTEYKHLSKEEQPLKVPSINRKIALQCDDIVAQCDEIDNSAIRYSAIEVLRRLSKSIILGNLKPIRERMIGDQVAIRHIGGLMWATACKMPIHELKYVRAQIGDKVEQIAFDWKKAGHQGDLLRVVELLLTV